MTSSRQKTPKAAAALAATASQAVTKEKKPHCGLIPLCGLFMYTHGTILQSHEASCGVMLKEARNSPPGGIF
jgi:hypothetical protein